TASGTAAGAGDERPSRGEAARGGGSRREGHPPGDRGARRRADDAEVSRADSRGEHGGQPRLRADGGGGGAGEGLLPGQEESLPGGRGGVQLVDPEGLLPGLRADHGHAACAVLPIPGGLGGRPRRGAALVDLCGLAAVVLAGAGKGSDRSVAGLGRETGQAAGGGRAGREGPPEAGGGGAELSGEQPGEDGLPALPKGRIAYNQQS